MSEAAGPVDSSSLAAESVRSHGAFASNRGAEPRTVPDLSRAASAPARTTEDAFGSGESQGQTAPSYIATSDSHTGHAGIGGPGVASTMANAPSRSTQPKAASVQEGFEDSENGENGGNVKFRDGIEAAFAAEPGGVDDPSRLAEKRFMRGNMMTGAVGAGGKGTAEREEGMYGTLESDEEA